MLKHASNASGAGSASATTAATSTVTANGQLRNSSSNAAQQQQPRSIHLRPPQPLNISTISAASLASNLLTSNTSASTATAAAAAAAASSTNTGLNGPTANGGQRIPTAILLNLTHGGGNGVIGGSGGGAGSTTVTTTTPVTPITPIIPNGNAIGISSSLGIGNNLHTYTNQHITATNPHNTSSNNILNSTAISTTAATNNANNNYTNCRNLVTTPTPVPAALSATTLQQTLNKTKHGPGPREALTSLGLLCLVSLLLALLSLIFLLKISPNGREQSGSRNSNEDFIIVYDVTLALCALSLSLNLCCLLVCAIQFLFAVKLLRSPMFNGRDNKYLEKSSISRTCAVGGFFISIPIFLTGIILYTLNHFHSTPAIITSVLIGIGIIFCGCAMVHNVFVWQKEKTISYRSPTLLNMSTITQQLQQLQPTHQHQQSTQTHNIGPVTPTAQFLNSHNSHHNHYLQHNANNNNSNNNATTTSHYNSLNQCHGQQTLSPLQLLQQQQFHQQQQQHQLHNHQNHHHNHLHSHLQQHGLVQGGLGPSMTPVSPNHSHGSFNPLLAGTINSSFLMRPATATPPTPKPIGGGLSAAQSALARATSPHGSVSPGQGPGIDMSNITNASLHELSTLV